MTKRQQRDDDSVEAETPTKRVRRATAKAAAVIEETESEGEVDSEYETPQSRQSGTPSRRTASKSNGTATPKPNGKTLFATPSKRAAGTPSRTKQADRSAKRKSAKNLAVADDNDEDDWDGSGALAREILNQDEGDVQDSIEVSTPTSSKATPSKRGRGRPPGAKNKRSPTPEGDIAPEEKYFFQNRMGPLRISNNVFSKVKPLTHDEYFEYRGQEDEVHKTEKAYLMKLHGRAFPQWALELSLGYSVCLYGYGSKLQLTTKFATWLYGKSNPPPSIVVVNGYTPKLNIRTVLNTIGSVLVEKESDLKLVGQPQEMVETLLIYLEQHPPEATLYVLINTLDSAPLRKLAVQSVLARLAEHPLVHLIATADSPTFPLMWNSSLLDRFNFVFHDCTTFAPYRAELNVVDDVNELLGRKGRRAGGQEGVRYVLQSLPPNAQKLYRILITEILSILTGDAEPEEDEESGTRAKPTSDAAEDTGVEYRILYDKACDAFICTSEMNFRFLMKEFHDHQMITSRRDAAGTELMCVPLGQEEMQGLLQDLISLD
ncbi:Origin recognition complex subunit 2 [Cyphellophora attinorum]|uniref:Origin recognition complex subunit 2 n=1 Tax=Cyphellophora attinorum TaxID=1664694 RepID=A0A0N0NK27_9EURO|nr:Origin recognition complex subunit 2 [Phialophora attinorum]KPI37661.1 Origin recognition complex subunit 2 [Phialophora attinorum]